MAMRWCPCCKRQVPSRRKDATARVLFTAVFVAIAGLFTCGLAWGGFLFAPFAQFMSPYVCPICTSPTSARQLAH